MPACRDAGAFATLVQPISKHSAIGTPTAANSSTFLSNAACRRAFAHYIPRGKSTIGSGVVMSGFGAVLADHDPG